MNLAFRDFFHSNFQKKLLLQTVQPLFCFIEESEEDIGREVRILHVLREPELIHDLSTLFGHLSLKRVEVKSEVLKFFHEKLSFKHIRKSEDLFFKSDKERIRRFLGLNHRLFLK
jgi:hypothetical protein